jgi:hypothetical protein
MRRLIQGVEKNQAICKNPETMKAFAHFLEAEIAFAPESVEVMRTYDVADLMMETMSLHGQDAELSKAGGVILQSVVSATQARDIVVNNLEPIETMLNSLSATDNPVALAALETQIQSMSSMMMVEGALASEDVTSIMSMIGRKLMLRSFCNKSYPCLHVL